MRRVAFVTGSSRGIGYGILKKFAENGYRVIMSATSGEEKAKENLDALKNAGYDVVYIRCDVSSDADRKAAYAEISQRYGYLDVLVNNAGIAPETRLNILETTEESFDRVLDTNLKGTFFMCQLFAKGMIDWMDQSLNGHPDLPDFPEFPNYRPRIVNISSMSAYTTSVNRGEYCISKAGISMVTALFADMLARYHIPVFEVRPGIIRTDMTKTVEKKYDKFILKDNGLPMPRWGTPKDVAEAVFALTSGSFDYGTGQVIDVDGGFHLRRL